ncbi:MAG: hypothetical protein SWX82_18145 [Cyanobacteriota bacterium]|nr:hypothetical protein [Cyanobacteriota bacterium]
MPAAISNTSPLLYLHRIAPLVERLQNSGMWISQDVRQQVLDIAGE